ncbi:MAG: hypothetical protein MUF54_08830, partial [Polyangiaceae bacterium]|nr:hypothetical protein [Polyangiaceae bacterium]
MTTRLQRLFAFLVVVTCAVACSADFQSADIDSDTGRTTQLLTTAGSLPTPRSSVQWSLADLIAADAWAQCSFLPGSPTPVSFRLAGEQDRYLDALSANMENTMTAYRVDTNDPNSDTRVTWLKFRANSAYNVDGHGSPAAMSFGEDYTLSGAAITVPAPNPLSTNTDLRDQHADFSRQGLGRST